MKTLYLVRHAKSSWEIDNISDKDRPLKGRGIRDAHLMSSYLRDLLDENEPVKMYSSPATRALHTALIFAKNFSIPASQLRLEDELYHCGAQDLHQLVRRTEELAQTAFYFLHNPTITDYVNSLGQHKVNNVPTTGVVCLRFDVEHWKDIDFNAELIEFQYPKRLKK